MVLVFSAVLVLLDDRRRQPAEVVAGSVYLALISLVAYVLPVLGFLLVLWALGRRHRPSLVRGAVLGLGLLLTLGIVAAVLLDGDGDAGELLYAAFPLAFGATLRLPPNAIRGGTWP